MSEINGLNVKTVQHNGEYGNAAVSIFKATLNAAQIADTVKFGDISGGNEVYRATLYRGALGAGVTMSLGYRMKDAADGSSDLTAFLNAADVAAAGRAENAGNTVIIPDGKGAEIVATIGGAATAASDIDVTVVLERVYHGQ